MAPPLSSPRTRKIWSAVRCCISWATISAGRPPIRFPTPMAVRPASPIGNLAIFAARVTGFLGTSFTLTLFRMDRRGWYGPGRESPVSSAHCGTRLVERPLMALGVFRAASARRVRAPGPAAPLPVGQHDLQRAVRGHRYGPRPVEVRQRLRGGQGGGHGGEHGVTGLWLEPGEGGLGQDLRPLRVGLGFA